MSDWMSTFPGYRQVLTTAKKAFGRLIQTGPTPNHVGIIMDGNRRYAKSQKIEIKEGHNLGFDTMANVLELLYESGVKCASVYAFSIENFKRSSFEVKWLMDLAKSKFQQINQHGDLARQYGIKIRILGNKKMLPPDVAKILEQTEEMTKDNTRAILNVCFPYTSRDEITNSIKCAVDESTRKNDFVIDEESLEQFLYTSEAPPLDLLVRTSGTFRLSDFLLWQCVSPDCSVVFVDKLWPAFSPWDMAKILFNWSFNKYWYGNGNGPKTSMTSTANLKLAQYSSVEEVTESSGTSGFKRFSGVATSDEEITEGSSSDIGQGDEIDTLTSGEDSDSNRKSQ
ncbi:putative undecaprenyl diphosphate synthase-domain-containing protein [Scheffersomyces xylosifermentans]|uniref:putative undecaprenyl diphosphate synthase-domain-containing protein n=1 Tax=Scheffersomyces xylosifermentans TaxID=1304137 RepID=UPI00315C6A54